MFCPKCSQSQVSEDVRFCSRCGFPLEGVAELLAADGVSAIVRAEKTKGVMPYLRGKGALVGAKITFFSLFLIPVGFMMALAVDNPVPLFLAAIPFFIGLVQMLYAIIFGKHSERAEEKPHYVAVPRTPSYFPQPNPATTAELSPAAEQVLIMPESKSAQTAEVLTPPSVTEETTKLLKNG